MSKRQYARPADEYAFEDFCLVLMRDVWKLPSLEKFGHRGERQHGVDLLDMGADPGLKAVQCKHKDGLKTLPPADLEEEIAKALTLPDAPLADYWVLTTAKRSTLTQRRLMEINREHARKGLFRVTIKFWDDIEALIDDSPAAQRHLELRVADGATAAEVRSAIGDVLQPVTASVLHAGLDEAKVLLESGDLGGTSLVLRKVRARWGELSSAQKARWATLRADVLLRQGNEREAAALLLEARDQTPDDEWVISNAIVAMRILDDAVGANALARDARTRFSSSAPIWAAAIDAASTSEELAALIAALPTHLREAAPVCVAIAVRGDPVGAPGAPLENLERAVAASPDDVRGWFHLGLHLLSAETRTQDPDRWEGRTPNPASVQRAIDALTTVVTLCRAQGRKSLEVEARLHRTVGFALQHDLDHVRADIDAATALEPADPQVQMARARLLAEEGSFESAIPVLRQLVQRGGAPDAEPLLASALWNRNAAGDRHEATVLLRHHLESHPDPAGAVHVSVVDGLLDAGHLAEAKAFVAVSSARLDPFARELLAARIANAENDNDAANAAASAAMASLVSSASRRHFTWASRLLMQLSRFLEALPLLERLADNPNDLDASCAYAHCAQRLGRHDLVLETCARARAAGTFDDSLLSLEIPLLDRYDPHAALAVLAQVLERDPADHRARVHRVGLALRVDRDDVVVAEIGSLPHVEVVSDAEEGAAVVRIFVASGRSDDAMVFAYDLLRRFFSEPHAHRAFIHAMLWRDQERAEAVAVTLDEVVPGTAVSVREQGCSDVQWFVLEDSRVPASRVENELEHSSQLWGRLIGRHIGDEVDLASSASLPGLARNVRVIEILPKLTFRVRDALDRWQYRFPEHEELWMVRVSNEATGEFDPTPLLEMARAQHVRRSHVEGVYRANMLPVGVLARALHKDAFNGALHVATTPDLPMRCAVGTREERAAAFAALDSCNELVLDPVALATLFLLDSADVLKRTSKRIIVPQTLMTDVREFLHDATVHERSVATLTAAADGPILHVDADGEKALARARVLGFKQELDRVSPPSSTTELALMPPAMREKLRQVVDEATLEAIAIGSTPHRVLWTDDVVVSGIAKSEMGTRSVWTQAVLLWLLERGLFEEGRYAEISARLIGLGYVFTSLSPAVVAAAARLAQWRPEKPPLDQVLAQFGLMNVTPRDAAQLGAMLVRETFMEPLPIESRTAILFAVCARLTARATDATVALSAFEQVLPRVFGLNVVGEEQALKAYRIWRSPQAIVRGG